MGSVPETETSDAPGKRRTWWHPLLVGLLEWCLRDSCEVRDEVSVARMPLRIDVVLVRRLAAAIPEFAYRGLSVVTRRLNAYTLIEFKSPLDALERGDLNRFLSCAHLFVAQTKEEIVAADITMIVLAPKATAAFDAELEALGCARHEEETGVHRITGGLFTAYLIETDPLAGVNEPVLTMFSHPFLQQTGSLTRELRGQYENLMSFVVQQIVRFHDRPQFEVNHMAEKMYETLEEVILNMPPELRTIGMSMEERMKGIPVQEWIKGIPAKDRLQGIPTEERLQGIPAEERLHGLTPEEAKRLQKLLEDRWPK